MTRYDPYGYPIHPGDRGYSSCWNEPKPREMEYREMSEDPKRDEHYDKWQLWKARAEAWQMACEAWRAACMEFVLVAGSKVQNSRAADAAFSAACDLDDKRSSLDAEAGT